MSVHSTHIDTHPSLTTNLLKDFNEYLDCNIELKNLYGEVNTPFQFINTMLKIIPDDYFINKDLKWLDPGSGKGNFSVCLFYILYEKLSIIIPNNKERKDHIIQNMIYMVEINPQNIIILKRIFGEKANIYECDYLTINKSTSAETSSFVQPDIIIGNPPYNINGLIKVPTNTNNNKKKRWSNNMV